MVKYTAILPLLSIYRGTTATGGPSYPINVKPHNYSDVDGVLLQGFLSKPTNEQEQYPAVIILHDQDGPNDYEQQRATLIAQELGYVGFAADVYGFGVELPPEDGTWGGPRAEFVGQYTSNATLFSTRIQAAIDYIGSLEYVDPEKIVLIGYCLGGTGIVHYLNTRGEDSNVAGACGVHPSLLGNWGGPLESINVPALFLTGGSDFLTGPQAMSTLETDMAAASDDAPWETIRYSKINHAFSNWFSEENYNEGADTRSWDSFTSFASEVFGEGVTPAAPVEANVAPANDYKDGNDGDYPLTGFAAFPSQTEKNTPVVVILPSTIDENGPGEYEKQRATQIALDYNYIAFVADIYSYDSKDMSLEGVEEMYYSNTTKFMSRVIAAIDYAKTIWTADPDNLALIGFGFGGSGALMYGMGVGGETDGAVKVIASFHSQVAKVLNATADMFSTPAETDYSSWGSGESSENGSWNSGEASSSGSWGSGGDGSASWGSTESVSWSSTGDGDSAEETTSFSSSNVTSTNSSSGQASVYPWDSRSMIGKKPPILIQSGVIGDDMSDIISLEKTLIGAGADYELSRFSDAHGDFTDWNSSTYDPRATDRSFDQLESMLFTAFAASGSETGSVTVPIDEITGGGQSTDGGEAPPSSAVGLAVSGHHYVFTFAFVVLAMM